MPLKPQSENLEKLNLETALIPWKDLQRFFASGQTIYVSSKLDLIDVADAFSRDDKSQVESWLTQSLVTKVSDQQAMDWFDSDVEIWSVVVKPWVLVQDIPQVTS